MPIYNGSSYMRDGIDCILSQTYQNIELILIDDCSSDDTSAIMNSYQDSRIRIIHNVENLGASAARSLGIQVAAGKYIALMDHDDICVPNRLTKQIDFMESYPDIGVCSSWIQDFSEDSYGTVAKYETDPEDIKCHLLFYCLINNSSAMIRQNSITQEALAQSNKYPYAGDYALWMELSNFTKIAILPEVLLYYRIHPNQISSAKRQAQIEETMEIQDKQLKRLGLSPSHSELVIHLSLGLGLLPHKSLLPRVEKWLLALKTANSLIHYYPEPAFSRLLDRIWNNCQHD